MSHLRPCAWLVLLLSYMFRECSTERTTEKQLPLLDKDSEQTLLVTAVRNREHGRHDSYLECLRLPEPFHSYPTAGSSSFLSAASNVTLVVLPPGSEEGWHRPPAPMWFFLLRGTARVVTPSTGHEVWIGPPGLKKDNSAGHARSPVASGAVTAGSNNIIETQMVMALDVQGKGHLTYYPGNEEALALQVPLGSDWETWFAELEVVHEGPC